MDLIVAVCRSLASPPRLHVLRALHARPGCTVSDLATTVGLTPESTSHHLKLLRNFHFVQARPSGRQVRYRPTAAAHVSNVFLRDIQGLLGKLLEEQNSTPVQVWNSAPQHALDEALIKLFTTYTHLRRLLMLRHLARHGTSSAADLAHHVGMSPPAISRHLSKLQRRGVVAPDKGTPPSWRLATPATATPQRMLLGIVMRAMQT